MSYEARDRDALRNYMDGIMARAEKDTMGVIVITLALLGGIVWQSNPGSLTLQSMDSNVPVNVLWASFGDRRVTFSYNHGTATIEMREDAIHGPVTRKFSTRTLEQEIESFFGSMKHNPQ
jgi:hypothetical protein